MPRPPPPIPLPPPLPCWARAGAAKRATSPIATNVLIRVLIACNSLMQAGRQYRARGCPGCHQPGEWSEGSMDGWRRPASQHLLSDDDGRVDHLFLELVS